MSCRSFCPKALRNTDECGDDWRHVIVGSSSLFIQAHDYILFWVIKTIQVCINASGNAGLEIPCLDILPAWTDGAVNSFLHM